jgi:hypothetical protein
METHTVKKIQRLSADETRYFWSLEWRRYKGESHALGIFTLVKPVTAHD